MPEKPLPFVITDRRKFTSEGETRPEAQSAEAQAEPKPGPVTPPAPEKEPAEKPPAPPQPDPENVNTTPGSTTPGQTSEIAADDAQDEQPMAPTDDQMEQSRVAFEATAERLDTAVRAANPGMEHPPAMSFSQLVQSIYMQAILQLGGVTREGDQPQIDILGARQSIDILGILGEKTSGNLQPDEQNLLSSALFELRLAFLEMTQAIARSAQQRAAAGAIPPVPGASGPGMAAGASSGGGPRIVR